MTKVLLALMGMVMASAAHAMDCRYSGQWTADNGDVMVLGGISDSREGGTFYFHSAFPLTIRGGYRIEGDNFHFKGADEYGSIRDVTMPIARKTDTEIDLGFNNRITGHGVQAYHLTQRDPNCR